MCQPTNSKAAVENEHTCCARAAELHFLAMQQLGPLGCGCPSPLVAASRGLTLPCLPQSSDATIGALKALEARQDKMRSELHAVAGTATLAGAKADSLAAEVARLQRRVHGSGGAGSPLSPRGGKAAWRLY